MTPWQTVANADIREGTMFDAITEIKFRDCDEYFLEVMNGTHTDKIPAAASMTYASASGSGLTNFHFQWDEPLIVGSVVLAPYSTVVVNTNRFGSANKVPYVWLSSDTILPADVPTSNYRDCYAVVWCGPSNELLLKISRGSDLLVGNITVSYYFTRLTIPIL